MTSINFHFRPSTRAGYCEGRLFIRVIHKRKPKNIVTGYKLFPHEWDAKNRKVLLPENDQPRLMYLNDIRTRMADDIHRLQTAVKLISRQGEYTVEEIAGSAKTQVGVDTLWAFSETLSKRLQAVGRERTARAYRTAARSLIAYNKGIDPQLADIDEALIKGYETHLTSMGRGLNTISFYMRNLRAIYFKAVRLRIIMARLENPFINVYTGVCESRKRALAQEQINTLGILEARMKTAAKAPVVKKYLSVHHHSLYSALMLFMFSYHARGMSFVDMAYLKKTDIRDGQISYRRHKTGGQLNVKVTEPMQDIIERFRDATDGSEYVFPVIDDQRGPARVQYENGLRTQNKRLKELGRMVGIEHLSTHVARHTWATLAKKSMIDIQVISEALGHKDMKTTSRYLASFDQSTLDKVSEEMSGLVSVVA
ncbi:site-specific integrase [Alistipes sp. OttesenSCG-928-B03]|nr:site-specific integrase [Alistipes sp. OttesenSCG-928-B03]